MPGPSSTTLDEGTVGVLAAGDVDRASSRCVPERVVDDVGECAIEPVGVDRHLRAGACRDAELDSALVGGELEGGGRVR